MNVVAADWTVADKSDAGVADLGSRILELARPTKCDSDRRKDERIPFAQLVELTPIDDSEIRVISEPVNVVGKHLATRGLDFFHTEALPFKRAIVSFDSVLGLDEHFVLNLSWCRFLRPGWYDSGGRFTHVVSPVRTHASSV